MELYVVIVVAKLAAAACIAAAVGKRIRDLVYFAGCCSLEERELNQLHWRDVVSLYHLTAVAAVG